MRITFHKKIGRCISLKRKSSAHAAEDRIQFSLEYKVFNLSNGLLIFKCLAHCHISLVTGLRDRRFHDSRDAGKIQRLVF